MKAHSVCELYAYSVQYANSMDTEGEAEMEGIAKVAENRERESVYSFTIPIEDLELMVNAAKRASHPLVTFELKAQGFIAGEKSKAAGRTFHNWVSRHWAPKPKE